MFCYHLCKEVEVFEHVRERIKEILEIAETCPEKYQVKCFEVLLESLLTPQFPPAAEGTVQAPDEGAPQKAQQPGFFQQHNIAQDVWSKVFNIKGETCDIIVRDLKVKPKSRRQIRLALLGAVANFLVTGKASVTKQWLVDMCKRYGAYDSPNFSAHMRKRVDLFVARGDVWEITVPGQQEAANVIKELGGEGG